MADLVDRLRSEVTIGSGTVSPLRIEAADEIERLTGAFLIVLALMKAGHWGLAKSALEDALSEGE
jgi:hypothetical protein